MSAASAGVLALHGRNYLIVRNAITVSLKLGRKSCLQSLRHQCLATCSLPAIRKGRRVYVSHSNIRLKLRFNHSQMNVSHLL